MNQGELGDLNVVIGANIQPLQESMQQAVTSMEKATKTMRSYFNKSFNGATKAMTDEMVKMQLINKEAFAEATKIMTTAMTQLVTQMSARMAQAFAKANKVAVSGIKKMVSSMKAEIAKGVNVTMIQKVQSPKDMESAELKKKEQLQRKLDKAAARIIAQNRKEMQDAEKARIKDEEQSQRAIEKAENKKIADAKKTAREKEKIRNQELAAERRATAAHNKEMRERARAERQDALDSVNAIKAKERAYQNHINRLRRAGWDIERVGQAASMYLTLPIVAAGAAAYKMASDYDEALNKVRVAFGNSSGTVENFSKKALESTGMSQKMALTTAGLFGDMATSMGLTRKEAADLSVELTQLVGDVASFKNLNFEEVKTALQGIFTGETESLKRMGVVMTVEAVQEWADAMGKGIKYSELAIEEKLKLRAEYVKRFLKNSVGDFNRTFDQSANQMRIFQSTLADLGTSFGHILMETITPLLTSINEMLKGFLSLDDGTKNLIITIGSVLAATGPLLTVIGFFVGTILPASIQGLKALGVAFKWLWGIMLANPYITIGVAIAGVLIYLYNLYKVTDKNAGVTKKYNDAINHATAGLKRERAEMSNGIRGALLYNKGSVDRYKNVKKLAEAYPELNLNILEATNSDEGLLTVLEKVNAEYEKRIQLQAKIARRDTAKEMAVEAQMKADDLKRQIEDFKVYKAAFVGLIEQGVDPLTIEGSLTTIPNNILVEFIKTYNLFTQLNKNFETDAKKAVAFKKWLDTELNQTKEIKTSGVFAPQYNNKLGAEYNNLLIEQSEAQKLANGALSTYLKLQKELGTTEQKINEEAEKNRIAGLGYFEGLKDQISKLDDLIDKAKTAQDFGPQKGYMSLGFDREKLQREFDREWAKLQEAVHPIKFELDIELRNIDLREQISKITGEKYDATGERISAYNKAINDTGIYSSKTGVSKIGEIQSYSDKMKALKDVQLDEYLAEINNQIKEIEFDAWVDQLSGLGDAGDVIKRQMDLMSSGIRNINKNFVDAENPTQKESEALQKLQDNLKSLGEQYAQWDIDDNINKTEASIKTTEQLAIINAELGITYNKNAEQVDLLTALIQRLNQSIRDGAGDVKRTKEEVDKYTKSLKEAKKAAAVTDYENNKKQIKDDTQTSKMLGVPFDQYGAQIDNINNSLGTFNALFGKGSIQVYLLTKQLNGLHLSKLDADMKKAMDGVSAQSVVMKLLGEDFDLSGAKIAAFTQLANESLSNIDFGTPEGLDLWKLKIEELTKLMKEWGITSAKTMQETNEIAKTIGTGIGDVFDTLGQRWMENAGLMEEGSDIVLATMTKMFLKMFSMLLSNAMASAIAGGAQGALFTGPAAPFTLPMYVAEMVGIVTSAFASVPKFKDGGIVDAPTLGMFGEYPGAKSNPEVVMPLDKLKSYIDGHGKTEEVYVHGQIAGDVIYITNERYARRKALVQ